AGRTWGGAVCMEYRPSVDGASAFRLAAAVLRGGLRKAGRRAHCVLWRLWHLARMVARHLGDFAVLDSRYGAGGAPTFLGWVQSGATGGDAELSGRHRFVSCLFGPELGKHLARYHHRLADDRHADIA